MSVKHHELTKVMECGDVYKDVLLLQSLQMPYPNHAHVRARARKFVAEKLRLGFIMATIRARGRFGHRPIQAVRKPR